MRPGNSYIFATALCALALALGSAAPAVADNKSPPKADHAKAATARPRSITDKKPPIPLQPGDSVICTIPNGKDKPRTVQIVVPPDGKTAHLCPHGGHITSFVISIPPGSVRHSPVVHGAISPVGGGSP